MHGSSSLPPVQNRHRQTHLILADGLHLLIHVLVQQLESLVQAQVVALSMQDVHFKLGQLILKLHHHHLLIIHCRYSHGVSAKYHDKFDSDACMLGASLAGMLCVVQFFSICMKI